MSQQAQIKQMLKRLLAVAQLLMKAKNAEQEKPQDTPKKGDDV